MSARDALEKFYARQLKAAERERGLKRTNGKPEREVERAILAWAKANGFSLNVVRAEAVYSVRAGRYLNSQVRPGFVDIVGSCPGGLACHLEIKAPGKRSTLREGQRVFLIGKITQGCFAVVVDSVECLEGIWIEFQHRRKMEPQLAKVLLLKHLPPESKRSSGELDFNECE